MCQDSREQLPGMKWTLARINILIHNLDLAIPNQLKGHTQDFDLVILKSMGGGRPIRWLGEMKYVPINIDVPSLCFQHLLHGVLFDEESLILINRKRIDIFYELSSAH